MGETTVPADDLETRGEAFDVPFEGAGQGLVEIVGTMSSRDMMPFSTCPAGIFPGQRIASMSLGTVGAAAPMRVTTTAPLPAADSGPVLREAHLVDNGETGLLPPG